MSTILVPANPHEREMFYSKLTRSRFYDRAVEAARRRDERKHTHHLMGIASLRYIGQSCRRCRKSIESQELVIAFEETRSSTDNGGLESVWHFACFREHLDRPKNGEF